MSSSIGTHTSNSKGNGFILSSIHPLANGEVGVGTPPIIGLGPRLMTAGRPALPDILLSNGDPEI